MRSKKACANSLLVALPDISNNVGSVKLFMSALLRSLQTVSLFVVFFGPVDDHGSPVIFRSVSVRPTHLSAPSSRPRLLVQTPSREGAGCPFMWTAFSFTPCPVPSCPACEPNLTHSAYSQPFRHIQYNRTPSLRAIATLAMFRCRRSARCRYRRLQSASHRAAACAASPSKKRNSELPCLVTTLHFANSAPNTFNGSVHRAFPNHLSVDYSAPAFKSR
jgi:hypothetical protein